jgi:hypothetical protein
MMARSNSANTPSIWNMARPRRGRGVEPLLVLEVDAPGVQLLEYAQQISKRAAELID